MSSHDAPPQPPPQWTEVPGLRVFRLRIPRRVRPGGSRQGDQIKLADGTGVPFRYAMVVPPFLGQDVVRAKPGLSDDKGYIPVQDTYQSNAYTGEGQSRPATDSRT